MFYYRRHYGVVGLLLDKVEESFISLEIRDIRLRSSKCIFTFRKFLSNGIFRFALKRGHKFILDLLELNMDQSIVLQSRSVVMSRGPFCEISIAIPKKLFKFTKILNRNFRSEYTGVRFST